MHLNSGGFRKWIKSYSKCRKLSFEGALTRFYRDRICEVKLKTSQTTFRNQPILRKYFRSKVAEPCLVNRWSLEKKGRDWKTKWCMVQIIKNAHEMR